MAREWLLRRGAKVAGPVSDEKLVALAKAGRLVETDKVSCDAGKKWAAAGSLSGLVFATVTIPAAGDSPASIKPTSDALIVHPGGVDGPEVPAGQTIDAGRPAVHEFPYGNANGSLMFAWLLCALLGGWSIYLAATGSANLRIFQLPLGVVGSRVLLLVLSLPLLLSAIAGFYLVLKNRDKPAKVLVDGRQLTVPRWHGRPLVINLDTIQVPEVQPAGYGMMQCYIKPKKGMFALCVMHSSWFGTPKRFQQFVEVLTLAIKEGGE